MSRDEDDDDDDDDGNDDVATTTTATRIDDDRDVSSLTTHNDASNRVISASLKAHSLEVTVTYYSCTR